MTALNPVLTVGYQITEMLLSHSTSRRQEATARADRAAALVGSAGAGAPVDQYPHELSGGQRQRVMIAMAMACDPVLLIADEPTTALDVTVQAEILDLLQGSAPRLDSAILLITHDMGVVADLADRVVVMQNGRHRGDRAGPGALHHPQNAYTQHLLAAVPHLGSEIGRVGDVTPVASGDRPTGRRWRWSTWCWSTRGGAGPTVPGGRRREFQGARKARSSGLVGESGSGKSTIGRAVASLLPITDGSVKIAGRDIKGLLANAT